MQAVEFGGESTLVVATDQHPGRIAELGSYEGAQIIADLIPHDRPARAGLLREDTQP